MILRVLMLPLVLRVPSASQVALARRVLLPKAQCERCATRSPAVINGNHYSNTQAILRHYLLTNYHRPVRHLRFLTAPPTRPVRGFFEFAPKASFSAEATCARAAELV